MKFFIARQIASHVDTFKMCKDGREAEELLDSGDYDDWVEIEEPSAYLAVENYEHHLERWQKRIEIRK